MPYTKNADLPAGIILLYNIKSFRFCQYLLLHQEFPRCSSSCTLALVVDRYAKPARFGLTLGAVRYGFVRELPVSTRQLGFAVVWMPNFSEGEQRTAWVVRV